MQKTDLKFLEILKTALQGKQYEGEDEISITQWKEIFTLAEMHHVWPLIYHTVFKRPEIQNVQEWKIRTRRYVMLQALKTDEFLKVYQQLESEGLLPIVVKGIVCRNLYPNPDLRISGDEDILVPKEQFELCHRCFMEQGMQTFVKEEQLQYEFEVPYQKKDGALYIEAHKYLFSPGADAYGDWNRFFVDAEERAIKINGVRTLSYTDHLFYLICHAFKHFLHSGFGIRQVCDIVMFANAYGKEVDWYKVYENCCEIHAKLFTATLFKIGQKYLTFDPEQAAYPDVWSNVEVDETHLLEDLLSGGVYGGSTMSRKHSSNMTLEAVSADKQGRKASISLKNSLFPSAKSLGNRYPYLKKHPYLLPYAWLDRIVKYGLEQKGKANNSAVESLKIGSERVELLREYKIIE